MNNQTAGTGTTHKPAIPFGPRKLGNMWRRILMEIPSHGMLLQKPGRRRYSDPIYLCQQ